MLAHEARTAWQSDVARLARAGIHLTDVQSYAADDWDTDYNLAADAQPALLAPINAGVPIMLTTTIDPEVIRRLYTPNDAERIYGSVKKGTWLDDLILFPVIEHTGEVTSYGDYNDNGSVNVNTNFPARQNYIWQTRKDFGDREIERFGLARLNLVAEKDLAAVSVMAKMANTVAFFGVGGMQNYGALNDPNLPPPITPGPKAAGAVTWNTPGLTPNATPNEVYNDILALYNQLVSQTFGLITDQDALVLCMPPVLKSALKIANSYGVTALELLKDNYPNITIETAAQFGALTPGNPQGVAAGNMMQMFAKTLEGKQTVYTAFSEKMRTFPIVRAESSYSQKVAAGAWGTVIRYPFAFTSMVGL